MKLMGGTDSRLSDRQGLVNDEGQESPGTGTNPGVEYGKESDQVACLGTRHSDAIAKDRSVRPINPSSCIDLLRHDYQFRNLRLEPREKISARSTRVWERLSMIMTDLFVFVGTRLRISWSRSTHRAITVRLFFRLAEEPEPSSQTRLNCATHRYDLGVLSLPQAS